MTQEPYKRHNINDFFLIFKQDCYNSLP